MFHTIDSQPQESLQFKPELLHTLCICCFRDSDRAKYWIHRIIPRDRNGKLIKWSSGGRKARNQERRIRFLEQVENCYDEIDFEVHCISSNESQISLFANMFYLQNLQHINQQVDDKNRNCLVFRINENKQVSIPVLRAANLIWIYFCIKYMKEVHNIQGFIYSDWFAGDHLESEDPALAASMVNFLLSSTGIDLQLSIAQSPSSGEADLLSDWFVGLSNSAKSGLASPEITKRFENLLKREPRKIDWVNFVCNVEIVQDQDL